MMSGQTATAGVHKGARRVQWPCYILCGPDLGAYSARADPISWPFASPRPHILNTTRFGPIARLLLANSLCARGSRFHLASGRYPYSMPAPFVCRLRPPPLCPTACPPNTHGRLQTSGQTRWRLCLGRSRVVWLMRFDSATHTDRSHSDRTPHHAQGTRRPSSSSARRAAPFGRIDSREKAQATQEAGEGKERAPTPWSER